jgi:uncharacterized protein involved in exopolysaccharide biosynthesis
MNVPVPLETFNRSDLVLFQDADFAPSRGNVKREFMAFARRYRRRLLWAFLLPFLLACALSFVPTPYYTGNAVLIIRLGPEYVYQTSTGQVGQQSQVVPYSDTQIFKSEIAILQSDALHRQVIEKVGLDRLYPSLLHPGLVSRIHGAITSGIQRVLVWAGAPVGAPLTPEQQQQKVMADAVQQFGHDLKVTLEPESAVIDVSFDNPSPAVVKQTLDALLPLYMRERERVYSEKRAEVAGGELQHALTRLHAAETDLAQFKAAHNVINFEAQRTALLTRHNTAQAEAQALTAAIAQDKHQLASLTDSTKSAARHDTEFTEVGSDTAFAAARAKLIDAQIKLRLMEERYAPSSPMVQRAKQEVADISRIMRSAQAAQTSVVRKGHSIAYNNIDEARMKTQAALAGAEAQQKVVFTQVADLDRQLSAFDSLDMQYSNLEQQVALDRQSVAEYSLKLNNARTLDDADRTEADGVRVVQPPSVLPNPVSMRRLLIAGGAVLAIIAMLAVGAWTEFVRKGFLTPEELERETGLTVLGVMPYRLPQKAV